MMSSRPANSWRWAQARSASRNRSACSSASRKIAPTSPDTAPTSSDKSPRTTRQPCRSADLALISDSRFAGTSSGILHYLLGSAQGGLQLFLILMRERGLENLPSCTLDLLQHLVRRGLSDQDEQRRAARLHRRRQLLDERVINAHIRECARDRPSTGAHG